MGYSDADHAGCVETRRSTMGYVFTVHGGAVSRASKLQRSVAISTMEAEYMAASEAAKEALSIATCATCFLIWATYDLGPIEINCDNQSAIKVIKNSVISAKSKHIEIRYHAVR